MERPTRAFPLSFQTTSRNQSDTHTMHIEFSTAGRTETTPVVPYKGKLVIADALHCLHDVAGSAEAAALTAKITEAIRRGERAGHGQVVGRPYAWRVIDQQTPEETEETEQTAPHTPGPWTKWEGRTVRVNGYEADIIGSTCAPVCYVQQGTESPATLANSRLIQIAPDLLAFVEMVRLGNAEFDQLEEMAAALVYRARHGRRPPTADQD